VPASPAPANKDAEFTRAASAAVERIEREDGFSGVILVARGDHVLLRKAAGFADREESIPNTPETKFSLMSVTKQFTAAGIMLLVQDRMVSLNDPVSKYYPASPPTWNGVTIKHLLTHTSGIGDIGANDDLRFRTYKDAIRVAAERPTVFAPGTAYSYNNAGYALLAAIIERISGQSYGDFLRTRIFTPLGMRNTGYGAIPGDIVRGYDRDIRGVWHRERPVNYEVLAGEGGIYSTIDDMLVWSRALRGNQILSAASREAMFTDYGHSYGFGWRFAIEYGRKLVWHTGNFFQAGLASIFDRFPEDDLTVVAMTNNVGLTKSTATLTIEGKPTTFPANAMRKTVEEVERLYFGRAP